MTENMKQNEYGSERLTTNDGEPDSDLNINDYIAIITKNLADIQKNDSGENISAKQIEHRRRIDNITKIVSYIRDKVLKYDKDEPKLMKEVYQAIENGEIDKKIIKFWIEEKMLDQKFSERVKIGYPELEKELVN